MTKPFYYLWVYDAHNDRVQVEHNEDRHPADAVSHTEILDSIPDHKDREAGYAYRIENGWRITTDEHAKLEDAHVLDLVKKALRVADHDEV